MYLEEVVEYGGLWEGRDDFDVYHVVPHYPFVERSQLVVPLGDTPPGTVTQNEMRSVHTFRHLCSLG
jgi:hypothetical protein